jgi:symplekin
LSRDYFDCIARVNNGATPSTSPTGTKLIAVTRASTTKMHAQTLQQLESARSLALGDGSYYPTIIPGVLPIIEYNADTQSVDLQRWGADFIAEAFASPTWPPEAKENVASSVLPTLKGFIENVNDKSVTKSVVQAAASVYSLVYKHT